MKTSITPDPGAAEDGIHDRILGAAFTAFVEGGFAGASTLEIATRARVSKRDLYANFSSKHAVLVACIKAHIERMNLAPRLPIPSSRAMLEATLNAFARNLVRETSQPTVIATFRLAIAEATRSPEIAEAIDTTGRAAARNALVQLLTSAQSGGLLGVGDPAEMATQFMALVWEGLMVSLLLGVERTPEPAEIERRAATATDAFMLLHAAPPE